MERFERRVTRLLQTTMSTRDAQGYPLTGRDQVPDRSHLAAVMGLLKTANARNDRLMEQLAQWKTEYARLRSDHLALKYGQLCSDCQLQRLALRDGEGLEVACNTCRDRETGLKQLLDAEEAKSRFWQGCYEWVLAQQYGVGQGDVDGADGGLP